MSTLYGTGTHRLMYKAKSFATGKIVTAYMWSPTLVKSALQSLTEISDGIYYLDYAFGVVGTYFGEFYEDAVATTAGAFRIDQSLAVVAAIKAKTDLITSGTIVTVISPVSADGESLSLVRGDDYKAADTRSLDFTSTTWPSLTGATIAFTIRLKSSDAVELTAVGSVVDAETCRVELDADDTEDLTIGNKTHYFDVQATLLTSENIVTLVLGDCTVLKDATI